MAESHGGDDKSCDNCGYLSTGRELIAVELIVLHAVHDACRVQLLNRVAVIHRNIGFVAYLEVADCRSVPTVKQLAENVRKVVSGNTAFIQGTELREVFGQELVIDAIIIVRSVPVFTAAFGRIEGIAVIGRMNTRGYGDGMRPCDGLLRSEGAVGVSDHDAPVVADLNAGVCPVTCKKIGKGVFAHIGDLFKRVQPLAGCGKGTDRQKARSDQHKCNNSGKLSHIMTSGRTDC